MESTSSRWTAGGGVAEVVAHRKDHVFAIFHRSLTTARLPRAFTVAKVVLLRKPDKRDYEQADAYCPVSLLPTLEKS